MKPSIATVLVGALIVASCAKAPAPAQESTKPDDASAVLAVLFAEHFERELELNPLSATSIGDYRYNDRLANTIGQEYIDATHALDKEFLQRINAVSRDELAGQDVLSYDMFKLDREISLEGDAFPAHLQPMNQFRSITSSFVRLGSGSGMHPFVTVKDYDDFLARTDDFVTYVDQAILNMKEGAQKGVVQPRILIEKLVPQLESQIVDEPQASGFFVPVKNMPREFSDEERARLTSAYTDTIQSKIIPAFARLNNFLGDEYLESARDSVGMLDLPGGKEWYAYLVRQTTTTDLTPDEIHQIGLDEVERIHDEMRGVMQEVGFDGSLSEFFEFVYADPQFFYDEPAQLIQAYRDMSDRVAELTKKLFNTFPKTTFEVRRVEQFREQSSSKGSYQRGTPDGSRPGIFYANAYNVGVRPKWDMRSLFLHEAIPGHHYQISLQQEAEDLPRFRRFGGYTAYSEGWGLYAETLGKELGMYEDPYDYFGALNAQLWRSIRLVVDTGLHAKGWSRQEVLDYMYANSAVSQTRAVSEAERFMAIPSQALAYKIGQLRIRDIRNKAEARLGDKFDIRAFHTEVLKDGAMPLSMLEAKIGRWVDSQL